MNHHMSTILLCLFILLQTPCSSSASASLRESKQHVPSAFVNEHALFTFDRATIISRGQEFPMILCNYLDSRITGISSHVVLKGNWMDFKEQTNFNKNRFLNFRLVRKTRANGGTVTFDIR